MFSSGAFEDVRPLAPRTEPATPLSSKMRGVMSDVTPGEPFSELEITEVKHFGESTPEDANVSNYFLVTGSYDIVVEVDRVIIL